MSDRLGTIGIISVTLFILIGVLYLSHINEKKFAQYRIDHECKITGFEESSTGYTWIYDDNGGHMGTLHIPAKTHFKCDNGDYIREGDYR